MFAHRYEEENADEVGTNETPQVGVVGVSRPRLDENPTNPPPS